MVESTGLTHRVKLPRSLKDKLLNIFGKGKEHRHEIRLVEKDVNHYKIEHSWEVPKVFDPRVNREAPAYGGGITRGGVGGAFMWFLYENPRFKEAFTEEIEKFKGKTNLDVMWMEDPQNVLNVIFPAGEPKKFLELYGKLVELWHKHHKG